jgi:curved DNA-binding protein
MKYVDYYKVLGVDRKATQEELSRAFKTLARKVHPDLNKDPGAEEKFKQINEAYEVLKDPETRQRFDALGANWKHGAPFEPPPNWGDNVHFEFHGAPGGGGMGGFSDFFSQLFGGGRGGVSAGGPMGGISLEDLLGGAGPEVQFGGGPRQRPLDVRSELTVQLEDAYRGSRIPVVLEGASGQKRLQIKLPAGVRDGERIRLAGQGHPGPNGQTGDLYLTIHIAPHPRFEAQGDDLQVNVQVNAWDAALGGQIPVPTLDEPVQMTLPAGLSSGQRLRLRGKGLPRRDGTRGDLYARLQITVPARLTREQRELFTRLQQIASKSEKDRKAA